MLGGRQTQPDAAQAISHACARKSAFFYLQQARQSGIQQMPQIRIVQSGDETLIEKTCRPRPSSHFRWKQKDDPCCSASAGQKSRSTCRRPSPDAT